jgi:hypothetical protein
MASSPLSLVTRYRPFRAVVELPRRQSNRIELRQTLAELKSELAQVDRMIRVLEWASARPKSA